MTISKAIVTWLKQIDGFQLADIATDEIGTSADSNGLFRSPNRIITENIDGSYNVKEYFQFFARRDSQEDIDRQDNDTWIENLMYYIDDAGYKYALPTLDNNRTCKELEINGAPSMFQRDSDTAVYQITIAITYSREREE